MVSKSGGCNSSTRDDDDNNKPINNNNNTSSISNSNNKVDNWRQYFRKSNSDIFDIIEQAIKVAAIDCPKEYEIRKTRIAELLFSCRMTRCMGCHRVELATSHDHHHHDHGVLRDDHVHGGLVKDCFDDGSKGSKVDSTSRDVDVDVNDDVNVDVDDGGDDDDDDVEIDIGGNDGVETELIDNMVDPGSNFSYGDAEALTDLIEEEKEFINEVLRIKDILYNSQDESEKVLFESLRRLQLMHLTITILKETEIGKAVNQIRRHSSKDIRNLARSLIDEWKIIVDEWVKSTQELAEGGTPDSINPSTVEEEEEEEGLPSPPMDDGIFFSTQPMDFNQIFDGMDDDGNIRNSGEFNENRKSGGKPSAVKPTAPKRSEKPPKEATIISKDNRVQQMKMQTVKPSNTQSGRGRPLNTNGDVKLSKDSTKVRPKLEKPAVQRRPPPQPEKMKHSSEDSVQDKLAVTKRKLQERYQQAENAKRQRTIQVMEIHDIPKQEIVNKNPHTKFGNHNRHWANGRK